MITIDTKMRHRHFFHVVTSRRLETFKSYSEEFSTHYFELYTVNKEIKRSCNSEILKEVARDATRKSEKLELIRVVSRTISCSI